MLQSEGKKADRQPGTLGTLGSEEQYDGKLPGFPLCLIYPRYGARKGDNPEMPMGADKKCPN